MGRATPEGIIKRKVKDLLDKYLKDGYKIYSNWPVPAGFGVPMLDCVVCSNGHFAMVETKAPGKSMTPRQTLTAQQVREANGTVFEIDGDKGLASLASWIEDTHALGRDHP